MYIVRVLLRCSCSCGVVCVYLCNKLEFRTLAGHTLLKVNEIYRTQEQKKQKKTQKNVSGLCFQVYVTSQKLFLNYLLKLSNSIIDDND